MATARPGLGAALKDALRTFTPAVRWIILSCSAIWLIEIVLVELARPAAVVAFDVLTLDPRRVLGSGWVWQVLTFQFLHAIPSPWHVFWNMYGVFLFGRWLEERWGTRGFLTFYLTCGVGGAVLHLLLAAVGVPQAQARVLGASAGLFGVLVAVASIWPHRRILLMFIIPIELRFAALLAAVVTLLTAFSANGIAAFAHLGGMATGWLYLHHAWRLRGLLPGGDGGRAGPQRRRAQRPSLGQRVRDWRRRRRRSRFEVVEREWEDWLRDELDDETKH
jgi:membrane associated rhomboid family serine protease